MRNANLPPLDPDKGEWDEKALNRRRFLEASFWVAASGGVIATVGAGIRFLIGNSLEPKKENWVEIGSTESLAPGGMHRVRYRLRAKDAWRTVEQSGAVYAITEDGESYTVFDATCSHLGCLVRWQEGDRVFACPCHKAYFDHQGQVLSGPPPKPLRRLETKIENGVLWALI